MRQIRPPIFDGADELSDTTDSGPFGQWFVGVGLASALAFYAVRCLWTGRALFPARRYLFVEYHGLSAAAVGSFYLAAAIFMHLHWFWTTSPRYWGYAQLGKLLTAVGMIASLAVLVYSELAF
jgi:hypothetical protein